MSRHHKVIKMKINLTDMRYLVIANFPGSKHKIGEIIKHDKSIELSCKKYPAIFRKLAWYEMRSKAIFPEYVICNTARYERKKGSGFDDDCALRKNTVWRVKEWEKMSDGSYAALCYGCNTYLFISHSDPATKKKFDKAEKSIFHYKQIDDFPFGPKVDKQTTIRTIK